MDRLVGRGGRVETGCDEKMVRRGRLDSVTGEEEDGDGMTDSMKGKTCS